jgi:hypothetical protein
MHLAVLGSQIVPGLQKPQNQPHWSGPHCLLSHCGTQTPAMHWPSMQAWSSGHWPQVPPQPSDPQALPVQSGLHWYRH